MDNAWAWASQRGKIRDNEIHGEEEAKLVLDDKFAFNEDEGFEHAEETAFQTTVPRPNL